MKELVYKLITLPLNVPSEVMKGLIAWGAILFVVFFLIVWVRLGAFLMRGWPYDR